MEEPRKKSLLKALEVEKLPPKSCAVARTLCDSFSACLRDLSRDMKTSCSMRDPTQKLVETSTPAHWRPGHSGDQRWGQEIFVVQHQITSKEPRKVGTGSDGNKRRGFRKPRHHNYLRVYPGAGILSPVRHRQKTPRPLLGPEVMLSSSASLDSQSLIITENHELPKIHVLEQLSEGGHRISAPRMVPSKQKYSPTNGSSRVPQNTSVTVTFRNEL